MNKGLVIERHFTKGGVDPYSTVEYEVRSSVIRNPDGRLIFEMPDVEVPKSWSQVATDILAQKYFRKAGIPSRTEDGKIKYGPEKSIKQVAHRLAGCWRHWGEKHGYFASDNDAKAFYDELVYMIIHQVASPNSPQWFNTGLQWAYGITGPAQGHYYVDPDTKKVEQSKDSYTRPQPHACFIQKIKDDLVNEGSIFDVLTKEARIFKYGSGTGTNFSNLRGVGENLSGGGKSSGLMSFLKVFDRAAGAIKSGGTTRRAAKMVCLNMDHPEIESFIWWKVKEEEKIASLVAGSIKLQFHIKKIVEAAKTNPDLTANKLLAKAVRFAVKDGVSMNYVVRALDLAKQGYSLSVAVFDTDYNNEAYATVAGQNSNNSVRIPNDFFEAVEHNKNWDLIARTDGRVMRSVSARKLWGDVAYCAWASADPGVQFDTTINEWHTCPKDGRINASNPCSEYMFLDDTACNLASINLGKFYDVGRFNMVGYRHAIKLWTVVLEISVLMAQFPSKEVARNSFDFRTLGLGYANLGSMLMRMGVPYDSDIGRSIAAALTSVLCGEAYSTSAELADVLGSFERFEANKADMLRVIRNHRAAAYGEKYEGLSIEPDFINQEICPQGFLKPAQRAWDKALSLGQKYGFRNAQVTVIAPTGTIGLVMDCDTTGVEPDYALVKFKKLAGGGYFKIVNHSVPKALRWLGYSEGQVSDIVAYCLGSGTLKGAPFINHESLRAKGFTDKVLFVLEEQLPNISELRFAFTQYVLGLDFCNSLGFSQDQLDNPDFNMLIALGFSEQQISFAEDFVCGTMTLEGAPHLKEEHLPIFDCANRCGKTGRRLISPYGHLKMVTAVQPFISGAISKTINMASESTVQNIKDAYFFAWKHMSKAVALYRDGSKLSQPLTTTVQSRPELQKVLEGSDDVEDSVEQQVVLQTNGSMVGKNTGHIQDAKCSECGSSLMRQNGVCSICEVCGSTSGCS